MQLSFEKYGIYDFIKKWGVCLFFGGLLLLGLLIFRDYGMYYDDISEHAHGLQVYNYVFHGNPELLSNEERYHGSLVEFTSVVLEKLFHLRDSRDIYLFRHGLVFLWFYAGVIFFYLLCKRFFGGKANALSACLFLILSPRIFGHAFFNTKDIPAMAACIASIFTFLLYFENKNSPRLFWHAFACAVSVAIRLAGIFVVFLTLVFLAIDFFNEKDHSVKRGLGEAIFLYPCSFVAIVLLLWPVLLSDPLYEMVRAFKQVSHTPQCCECFYLGRYLDLPAPPWHYIPVWIAVSTPLAYLIYFFIGMAAMVRDLPVKAVAWRVKRSYLVILLWFFMPIVTVIALRCVIYNSWRHLYFAYPALVLIAAFGAGKVARYLYVKNRLGFFALIIVTVFSLVSTALFMVRNHPLEYIYFNRLAGRNMVEAKARFEMDYWALSYREGIEYLLTIDKSPKIKVFFADNDESLFLLPTNLRSRFDVVDFQDAQYYLTDFGGHMLSYPYGELPQYPKNKIYSVKVDGAEVMAVYRL